MGVLHAGRFAQFFRRLGSLKEAFVPDLQETVLPTMELLNQGSWDLWRNRGEHLVAAFASISPTVGQPSNFYIIPNVGTLFCPLYISLACNPFSTILYGITPSLPTPPFNPFTTMDNRSMQIPSGLPNSANMATRFQTDARVGAVTLAQGLIVPLLASGTTFVAPFIDLPLTLVRPDVAFLFASSNNITLTVSIVGYERAFEPQENF